MNDIMQSAGGLFVLLAIVLGPFILVWILRWALRINHICTRLDQLAADKGYADAARALGAAHTKKVDAD